MTIAAGVMLRRLVWAYRRWRTPSQAYFWTEQWQAGERETAREFAAGHGRSFDTAEDAICWLRRPDA